ncbi:uncharacterized [Tachysurus ichikawai]
MDQSSRVQPVFFRFKAPVAYLSPDALWVYPMREKVPEESRNSLCFGDVSSFCLYEPDSDRGHGVRLQREKE